MADEEGDGGSYKKEKDRNLGIKRKASLRNQNIKRIRYEYPQDVVEELGETSDEAASDNEDDTMLDYVTDEEC